MSRNYWKKLKRTSNECLFQLCRGGKPGTSDVPATVQTPASPGNPFQFPADHIVQIKFGISLFADYGKILMRLSVRLVIDKPFRFQDPHDCGHGIIGGLWFRHLLNNVFDKSFFEMPQNLHDLVLRPGELFNIFHYYVFRYETKTLVIKMQVFTIFFFDGFKAARIN
jgi:hypothetical protein